MHGVRSQNEVFSELVDWNCFPGFEDVLFLFMIESVHHFSQLLFYY